MPAAMPGNDAVSGWVTLSNADYEKTLGLFFDAGYRVFRATDRSRQIGREEVAQWKRDNKTPFDTFDYLIQA